MAFTECIKRIYEDCGPDHLLPFIGSAYESADLDAFRVAVIGLNAYVSDGDWPEDRRHLRGWYPGWWSRAGHGKSHRFFNVAYRETDLLATALVTSELFAGLQHDRNPLTKPGVYGTNAVKVFLGEKYKRSVGLEDILPSYRKAWHQELEAMAEHRVMPHLIVVLGSQIWEAIWRSLHPSHKQASDRFTVEHYQPCGGREDPCFHHANRIVLTADGQNHTLLLVRLSHPAAQDARRAGWLLGQPSFRALAGLL